MNLLVLLVALFGALAQAPGGAVTARPLPAFRLTAPDGTSVQSGGFRSGERTLLVFVAPGTPSSDRLLAAFGRWLSPRLVERTALVVGADLAGSQAWMDAQAPAGVKTMRWFADADGSAAAALQLTQPQALIGLRSGGIEWTVSGVLNDPRMFESVVRNWIGS